MRVEHVFEDEVQVIEHVSPDLASRELSMFNAGVSGYPNTPRTCGLNVRKNFD